MQSSNCITTYFSVLKFFESFGHDNCFSATGYCSALMN